MKHLSRVVAIPLAPVLLVQARWLRTSIPRLPDAAQPWTGSVAGPRPVRLLVLGDSTAAGVGAATQADALCGNLARSIRSFFAVGCPVCNKLVLIALGTSGALQYFEPIQPYLAAASIGLLVWALNKRVTGEDSCPVAPKAAADEEPETVSV